MNDDVTAIPGPIERLPPPPPIPTVYMVQEYDREKKRWAFPLYAWSTKRDEVVRGCIGLGRVDYRIVTIPGTEPNP